MSSLIEIDAVHKRYGEDEVLKGIAGLQKAHPEVAFTKIFTTVDNTRAAYTATLRAMLEGMGLASLVVFLFLWDWRSTAITARPRNEAAVHTNDASSNAAHNALVGLARAKPSGTAA